MIEQLRETVKVRHLRAAIDAAGIPRLTSVQNAPKLQYISLEDFLTALEEKGMSIDPVSLNITEKGAEPRTPEPPPPGADEEIPPAEPITPPAEPTDVWSESELAALGYRALQQLAKAYDDVSGAQSTAALRTALLGKPKSSP